MNEHIAISGYQRIMDNMILDDPDFGEIIIRKNARARNITMRPKADGLHVTVPEFAKLSAVLDAIDHHRDKMAETYRQLRPTPIDTNFVVEAPLFKLKVTTWDNLRMMCQTIDGWFVLHCPKDTDFATPEMQSILRKVVEMLMKKAAKAKLSPLLASLAFRESIPYKKLSITGARTRWGSCSAAGSISLSCYLLLLPTDLIEYVILHELAHIRELNHGEKFWALLDKMTDGKALQLRQRLNDYKLPL